MKDFLEWHKNKSVLHNEKVRPFFHEREVWWCSLGKNIGFEQDGKGDEFARPVLIFKKFNKEVGWILPISTRIKKNKFYADLNLPDCLPRVVIISQLRLIDGKRLLDKFGVITEENYKEIQKAVINLCNL